MYKMLLAGTCPPEGGLPLLLLKKMLGQLSGANASYKTIHKERKAKDSNAKFSDSLKEASRRKKAGEF